MADSLTSRFRIGRLAPGLRTALDAWMARRLKPRSEISLNRKNIYVLPTRNGLLFLLAAGLVFIAAINYAVSLAYGLAFMMVSLFILAILYTFNNLNQLCLARQSTAPVYCGEQIAFNVELRRLPNRAHEALEFTFRDGTSSHADLFAVDRDRVQVFTTATRRGDFRAPLLRVSTSFPLGLCRAWSVLDLGLHCLVYPKPVPFAMEQFTSGNGGGDDSELVQEGSEDFYGLRDYVPGDPLKQVAWKNLARGQGMHVKQFVDYVDSRIWLDWDMFYGFGTEERLSRLCYCVLKLSATGSPFGLKLPGVEIAPDSGARHRNRLLRTLALFGPDHNSAGQA